MSRIILLIALFCSAIFAHQCATDMYMESLMQKDPDMRLRIEKDELAIREKLSLSKRRDANTIYTVPTVVHIIYNQNNAEQNPTDQEVRDQIARLNRDYRRTNFDRDETVSDFQSVAADSKIQFILASTDPNGQPTTGITRTQTAATAFNGPSGGSAPDLMKATATGGRDPWPRDQYLNIWVCRLSANNDNSQTLGYANYQSSAAVDGIVIHTPAFAYRTGFYGRTLTHETGHWLNLRHTWGTSVTNPPTCGDDGVLDTPQKTGPSYQCQLDTTQCGTKSMVQNYMDYSGICQNIFLTMTDDLCMNIFSAGQAARMRLVLEPGGFRDTIGYVNYTGTVLGINDGSTDPIATATTGSLGFESGLPSELGFLSRFGLPLWAIIVIAIVALILVLVIIGACLRCLCGGR